MPDKSSRAMPDRSGFTIALSIFVGLLLSGAIIYTWAHIRLSVPQRRALPLYVQATIPIPSTVSIQALRPILPSVIANGDNRRVKKSVVRALIARYFFAGQPVSAILKAPSICAVIALFLCLIVGAVARANQIRRLRDGLKLRGPDFISARQFNRQTKGDGLVIKLAK